MTAIIDTLMRHHEGRAFGLTFDRNVDEFFVNVRVCPAGALTRDLFSHRVEVVQEEEDRQLEKPHSTPNSFRLSALHITGLDPESTAAVYPWLYNRKENPTHGGTEMS